MGYQIDKDGTIIRSEGKSPKGTNTSWLVKSFLILGLLALVGTLTYLMVSDRSAKEIISPVNGSHTFIGTVAGYEVHMQLNIDGNEVSGYYYYVSQRNKGNMSSLSIKGEKNGETMNLTESYNGEISGRFLGRFTQGAYDGTFTRTKDGKSFAFNLVELVKGQ